MVLAENDDEAVFPWNEPLIAQRQIQREHRGALTLNGGREGRGSVSGGHILNPDQDPASQRMIEQWDVGTQDFRGTGNNLAGLEEGS